jgi:NADH:flavin oxidoreductases, Old Yellow Enzyme family
MSPFQALNLPNGQTIGNRIAKAAMEENLADSGQAPAEALFRLYQAWAEGETGLLLTGNVMIDRRAMTGPGGVVLEDERHLERFRQWATLVGPVARSSGCSSIIPAVRPWPISASKRWRLRQWRWTWAHSRRCLPSPSP